MFCVNKIDDKENIFTENTAKIIEEKTINNRVEYHVIGDKTYVVVAEEKSNTTDTPLDIVKRLITHRQNGMISEQIERTRCLPQNGGKQL